MTATPRHHTPRDPSRPTLGGQVAVIAKAKRAPLLPWQRSAVDVALEVDPGTGLYHYGIVVVTVQRQAGKTKMEGDVADHRCLTRPRARVWITMQDGKTVDEWMREEHFSALRAASVFGVQDSPSARYKLSKRAGSVGVKWPALGSTFTTFAPTRNGLHSKQSDLVLVDEAWSHDREKGQELRQAIRPTMNTRPGAQLWVLSTEGDDASEYLASYVDLGVSSLARPESTNVCFIDYGIPEDADAEDLDVIAAHHPAYGTPLLSRASLEAAREEFSDDPAGWARAYGNRRTRSRAAAFPPGSWAACAGHRPLTLPDQRALGFDVNPAGDRAAVATAWRLDDGRVYGELIDTPALDRSLPDFLARAARAAGAPIDYDPINLVAVEVAEAVERAHPDVTMRRMTTAQVGAATANLDRLVKGKTLLHPGQSDLDAATEVAVRRQLGDGFTAWGRKGSTGSIAELCALTWAVRAVDSLPALGAPIF